jgi:hypothetical protein
MREGVAGGGSGDTVVAVGTATPTKCVYQTDYPDYFRVTRSEHLLDLKQKFKKICKLMGKEKN